MNHFKKAAFFALTVFACVVCKNSYASSVSQCAHSDEMGAINARVLQTELMVGALSCGQSKEYNQFVMRYREDISKNSANMRSYFTRVYKGSADSQIDRFVTRLANDTSMTVRSGKSADFCSYTKDKYGKVLGSGKANLSNIGDEKRYAQVHKISKCDQTAQINLNKKNK